MRITIEEYEMLQEVNEELEHHYQETEKKLHNDIGARSVSDFSIGLGN